jgi:hypothetical protein
MSDSLPRTLRVLATTIGGPLSEINAGYIREAADEIERLRAALHQHGHVVDIGPKRFGLEHPVECRSAGLLNCPVEKALEALPRRPKPIGRYPVDLDEDGSLVFGEAILK